MAGAGAIRAGRAVVEINADDSGFLTGLKRAEDQLKAFAQRTSEMGRQMMTASSVVLAPAGLATKTFAGFDDQMRAVEARALKGNASLGDLTEKAKELGSTMSFTAEEVAAGMVQLAQGGLNTDEIMNSIESVMNLARATGTDVPEAAGIAINTLKSFHLEAEDAGRVADTLATTANSSATNLHELGDALKYAATSGALAGESLESTLKMLGGLANVGLQGSLGGNALKTIQTRMSDDSIREKFKELTGKDTTDAEGNLRSVIDLLTDFREATANMGSGERLGLMDEIFGTRGMIGAGVLMGAELDTLTEALNNAEGAAAAVAEKMDAGVGGALRRFASAVEGVAIKIGESLAPEIQKLSEYLIDNAGKIGDWISQNKDTIVTVTETAAKIGATGVALIGLSKTVKAVSVTVGGFKAVMGGIALAAEAIAGAPVAAAIIAVGAAAGAATLALHDFGDSAEEVAKQHEERAATDNANLERLQALADKTQLTNREMLEAVKIAASLNSRYHDLGIEVDTTTGKITGLAGAQEKLNAAQLRTKIYDQQAILREKKQEYEDKYKNVNLGADKEYTLEELQELDRQHANVTTENHLNDVAMDAQGSNIRRAAYNEQTGKYQVASRNNRFGFAESTEKAQERLQHELDQAAIAAKEIADLQADIDALKALQPAVPGTAAPPITPAAAPSVAAANEAAQAQSALQAETNELLKENNKLQRDIRDGVNKESDTI